MKNENAILFFYLYPFSQQLALSFETKGICKDYEILVALYQKYIKALQANKDVFALIYKRNNILIDKK